MIPTIKQSINRSLISNRSIITSTNVANCNCSNKFNLNSISIWSNFTCIAHNRITQFKSRTFHRISRLVICCATFFKIRRTNQKQLIDQVMMQMLSAATVHYYTHTADVQSLSANVWETASEIGEQLLQNGFHYMYCRNLIETTVTVHICKKFA